MEIFRKLRFFIYPSAFFLVFIMAAYCTFPKSVLREVAETSITHAALNYGPEGPGLPSVALDDVSLWRLSGISIKGLKVAWPEKKNELPTVLFIDSLKARIGIFSLLQGSKSLSVSMGLYGGEIDFFAKILKTDALGHLKITTDHVNLAKMAFIETMLGAPMQGIVTMALNVQAKEELSKDGNGSFKLTLDQLRYGPGSLKLPSGGMVSSLTVPEVNLGKLVADFSAEKGQVESKVITLTGGDVEADFKLSITLDSDTPRSQIFGNGWFSIKPEFISANETLKMLYDLLPALRSAQQGDGKVGIAIRGTLARPDFSLERFNGMKPNENVKNKADDTKDEDLDIFDED